MASFDDILYEDLDFNLEFEQQKKVEQPESKPIKKEYKSNNLFGLSDDEVEELLAFLIALLLVAIFFLPLFIYAHNYIRS
jgi:hypothetical protein